MTDEEKDNMLKFQMHKATAQQFETSFYCFNCLVTLKVKLNKGTIVRSLQCPNCGVSARDVEKFEKETK